LSTLEASIESLTAEHTALTEKLEQIDQQYRVERPVIVSQISLLARALSALTAKTVAGPGGQASRRPMSAEGKAAIKAGLERARAAKQADSVIAAASMSVQKPAEMPSAQTKPSASATPQIVLTSTPPKKDAVSEKTSLSR
jgi:hypothetical protein